MPYLLLILATLFWSGNFVVSKGMYMDIPPLALSFWRWAVALLILSTFGLKHLIAEREIALKHFKYITVQSLLSIVGFNCLIYMAMHTTSAINAVLVNSCIPVIIVVISRVLYNERLSLRQTLGVFVSLGGVVLIISQGKISTLLGLHFNRGDIYVFIAAILWALYSANFKKYPKELHQLAYMTAMVIIGIAVLLPLYIGELVWVDQTLTLSIGTIVAILYVAIFASILGLLCWNRAVTILGANIAGPFIHLMPVFSTILAVIFLGERITPNHIKAICLIFCGILMTTVKKQIKK